MQNIDETVKKTGFGTKYENTTKLNTYYRRIRRIKLGLSYLALTIICVYSIFPIYYIFLTSLSPLANLTSTNFSTLLPFHDYYSFANYYGIIFKNPFPTWLENTLILTGTSTLIGVGLSITTGIAFSRYRIPGKRALLYMLLVLSMFPFTIMVIPFYFMFSQLHLLDTYIGLIIPYSAGAVIFSSWLIKNYVDNLPRDYEEAATLDGYSRTGALFRVLVPMAKPAILLAVVLAFMGPYTDYALAGQFITSPKLYTMAIGMYYISQGTITVNYGVYSAFAILMGIPIFILFFFFQKYIVAGFSIATYK